MTPASIHIGTGPGSSLSPRSARSVASQTNSAASFVTRGSRRPCGSAKDNKILYVNDLGSLTVLSQTGNC